MPLIIMCGIPGSGKTQRARQIKQYFEEKHEKKTIILNEEGLDLIKEEAYKDPIQEKYTRAFLKSNVEKNINEENIVILDSLNYSKFKIQEKFYELQLNIIIFSLFYNIHGKQSKMYISKKNKENSQFLHPNLQSYQIKLVKGYRYELYCLARAAKTQQCVFYCNTSQDQAWKFNNENENKFSEQLQLFEFHDYRSRMEVPNQKNRWDSPLIELRENEETPFDELADILLFQAKKSKDPVSTKNEVLLDENYLFQIDKRAQIIIDRIMEIQQDATFQLGNSFSFEGCNEKLTLNKTLSLIELKRLKKEFGKLMKQKTVDNVNKIDEIFIIHVQNNLNRQ